RGENFSWLHFGWFSATQFSVAACSAAVCRDAGGALIVAEPPDPHAVAASPAPAAIAVSSRTRRDAPFPFIFCVLPGSPGLSEARSRPTLGISPAPGIGLCPGYALRASPDRRQGLPRCHCPAPVSDWISW